MRDTKSMCRFVAYLGEPVSLDALLLRPSNSLVNQSFDAKEFRLRVNGDGFGVAWYPQARAEPVQFRTVNPAWSNQNLRSLAPAIESHCVLAHVRAASPHLAVVETNCHPFVFEDLAFCHNGTIGDFRKSRRELLRGLTDRAFDSIRGTTDSELLFAYVLDALGESSGEQSASDLAAALAEAARRVTAIAKRKPSYLNLALTNGGASAVLRFSTDPEGTTSSLYVHRGRRYACIGDTCRMIDEGGVGTTLVASERLSDDPGWERFPAGHVAAISADGNLVFDAVAK